MKRDMDLIRHILMCLEESEQSPDSWAEIEADGHTRLAISYHIHLLHDAGFIEADDVSSIGQYEWEAKSLTWAGHEFLDNARNETIWQKAKEKVGTSIGGS
ncbi:MAG: DUF2513 domain-containing protein [Alphaproteobacteria bacterium]|nr:DUF2513 domain-containing protein [Alphaproteobacteria bacterium]